jgi:hypothetical protein
LPEKIRKKWVGRSLITVGNAGDGKADGKDLLLHRVM